MRHRAICTLMAGFAIACLGSFADAGDQPDPTGTWKWSVKRGSQTREYTLKLKLEDDRLTGTLHEEGLREQYIEDGQHNDGELSFNLTRGGNEQTFIVKYTGKVSEDTITGTIEFERNGKMNKRDWEARREASRADTTDQPDPTGTWKWSVKRGDRPREYTLKLKLDGDQLTGTLQEQGLRAQRIENAQYKDGEVSFSLTRGRNVKYVGKVSEDTITGKIESERNGKMNTQDWEAKREKQS